MKQSTIKDIVCPLIAIGLCAVAGLFLLVFPTFSFPILTEPGVSTIFRVPALYEALMESDISVSGNQALGALKEAFSSFNLFDVVLAITIVLLSLLLLLAAVVMAIVALFRGVISGLRQGVASAKVSAVLLGIAQVLGLLLILGANARLSGAINSILQSQGVVQTPFAVVAPSLSCWLLLAATVAGFVLFTVIGANAKRREQR